MIFRINNKHRHVEKYIEYKIEIQEIREDVIVTFWEMI